MSAIRALIVIVALATALVTAAWALKPNETLYFTYQSGVLKDGQGRIRNRAGRELIKEGPHWRLRRIPLFKSGFEA